MNLQGNGKPDVAQVYAGLKNFQRASANHIFGRLYTDDQTTTRFLLADEVGLGKTHVARGIIANAINYLWEKGTKRIDVVYICSNADIARQNITKLNVTGQEDCAMPSRITLLPKTLRDIKNRRVNFVSFTPGTSFDLKSNLGRSDERVILYWLLRGPWRLKGRGPQNVLQGGTSTENFRKQLEHFKSSGYTGAIDSDVRGDFLRGLREHDRRLAEKGQPTLRRRFKKLARQFHRARENTRITEEERTERNRVVGELRRVLAGTCIKSLEPDLIILDEFQRFKYLLDGEDPASELAQQLFNYEDVRVLLVSATPYKMYTVGNESDTDDHYADFLRTIRFLDNDPEKTSLFEELIKSYRRELFAFAEGHQSALPKIKDQLENNLRRIMVRTERLAVSENRDGMLTQEPCVDVNLQPSDLKGYIATQRIAEVLGTGDPMEYWKSAPYLLNFMDDYQLKRQFEQMCKNRFKVPHLAKTLAANQTMLLPWNSIRRYRELDPANARLRDLLAATVDNGAWQMLWISPSLPYYQLDGVYRDKKLQDFTKRLVFSSWRVVPKALATMVSYEAERRMLTSLDKGARNTVEARKQRRGLLRFAKTDGRLTGMPLLGLLYPCHSLARHFDPRRLLSVLTIDQKPPTLGTVVSHVQREIEQMLEIFGKQPDKSGPTDDSWYWAAPILLDLKDDKEQTDAWWRQESLSGDWSNKTFDQDGDSTRFEDHIERALELLDGKITLGRPPEDLSLVLAQMAIASPGVCSLRALSRGCGGEELLGDPQLRNSAATLTWSLRSLFNIPDAMAIIRGNNSAGPYWRRVLEYCANGCLQAVLDEYVHVLQESLGILDTPLDLVCDKLTDVITGVIGIHVSNLGVDAISVPRSASRIRVNKRTMRARFAMRFGDEKTEEDATVQRASTVRRAFNSPFWPFVLATTSVGQEGLDFHPYCHAVVHWNLPSNPVDLEQREGRIHRYKGHAIRKNVAMQHGSAATDLQHADPWVAVFNAAAEDAQSDQSELIPYWIYPIEGGATIQRFIPALPLSLDLEQLTAVRNSLAIYRMVFGQPRQDDLVEYLLKRIPKEKLTEELNTLKIDLAPGKYL